MHEKQDIYVYNIVIFLFIALAGKGYIVTVSAIAKIHG